jgi:hypothetical protein
VITTRARLAFLAEQADLDQIANGTGDRGWAHPQTSGQLCRGVPVGIDGEHVGENPGRHSRNAGLDQDKRKLLDEPQDGFFVRVRRFGDGRHVALPGRSGF